MKGTIYLDHAATTQIAPEVLEAMQPFLFGKYGNASTLYDLGKFSRAAVEKARKQVAEVIGASPEEIYFTSGGSEADNWAIKATAHMWRRRGNHIITSKIEHHAVLNSCKSLEEEGFAVTYLNVDEEGKIRPEELERAIRPTTILISIMYANNEIGTIEPMEAIAEIAKKHHILLHTDAVQAYGQIPISVKELPIDMLSTSGHKLYGPKGIGCLYIRKQIPLKSFIDGGGQEMGKRAGTENVPGIVGFGKAAELAAYEMPYRMAREQQLRDKMIQTVLREIPYTRLNGSREERLPNNANFCFQFIEGGTLLQLLDMKGICASAASACSSGQSSVSHVLKAIDVPKEMEHGSLRFSLGKSTTPEEIAYTIECLKDSVRKLREKNPEYQEYLSSLC
ncbi:MAG: cysteine desulfurase NifS [Lachnospiraceae bacterium]|uniref:cysteine desulfurase NifS n=1 Tax=Roseburia hominis TaxID=301301 RepID=UPI001F1CA26D|nr:cysteine desulfurase NifS [Roseburia hominis]MCI5712467.1 cysteine desulfurase NifS [Lachnospiraceae bacterium]MDD6170505.1 cysteine desulfurase NifS [Lachnospiraceae bacterium]MDY4838211.1 cysteine desulfurase NifS [Lachnospiraceae bacterium]